MSWAKIKKALNSSLGGSNFKPLDQLITESFESIKNAVKNGSLIAGKANIINNNWQDLELTPDEDGRYLHTSLSDGVYALSITTNDGDKYFGIYNPTYGGPALPGGVALAAGSYFMQLWVNNTLTEIKSAKIKKIM